MAKVKVTTRFKIIEYIDRFVDNALANQIGKTIVNEAKDSIAEGISPVRGHGRFERYKNRKSYPGDLKPQRPVNLNLTGEMLAGYGYNTKADGTVEVGMVRGSKERKDIAGYHNAGTEKMAMRRIVPQQGEEWSIRIMRAIRDLYGERLKKLIKLSNK